MRQGWLKSGAVVAGVLMGSIGGVAMADEVTTPAGAELPVFAYQGPSGSKGYGWAENAQSGYIPMAPFLRIGYSEANGLWADVGSPRKLSGAMFWGRGGFLNRCEKFRVWGTDKPGPYTSADIAGMELVVSNYLGAVSSGVLTNYEGISAHRYYYFDNYGNSYNSEFNLQVQLYSDGPVVTAYRPREVLQDTVNVGDYVFTGAVVRASSEAGVEICMAVAREDFDADYAAWSAGGRIYKAAGTYQTGEAFRIAANGIASGRTYAKLFYRDAGKADWFAAPGTWQFASCGTLVTPRVYVWDKTNPTNANDSSQALYDGNYGAFGDGNGKAQQMIFPLDSSLDYAVLRVWARTGDKYECWLRSHYIKGLYVAKPSGEVDWSAAEKVEKITKREFYWIKNEADIPTMEWTLLPVASETMKHENQNPGINAAGKYDGYIDVVLDKKLMSGGKYLKLELAPNLMLNACEIELYTVKKESFCIRVQ